MKKILFFAVALILVSLTACEKKITDFENVIEVTPEDCVKWGLNEVHFKISHPTDEAISVWKAVEGSKNLSYIMIDHLTKDELSNEEISIGYCNNCLITSDEDLLSLIEELVNQFEVQLPNFEKKSIEVEKFWGEKRVVAKFTFGDKEPMYDFFEAGDYHGIITVITEGSTTDNGVVVIMLGNQNSGIEDFSDFGKKGNLADIFKTFRFVE
ncbi:MAG: hypothetical protein JXL97_10530 [Bacteroidales bacterium]|nr:hypothetical protein [Bacteroidales bacterium]